MRRTQLRTSAGRPGLAVPLRSWLMTRGAAEQMPWPTPPVAKSRGVTLACQWHGRGGCARVHAHAVAALALGAVERPVSAHDRLAHGGLRGQWLSRANTERHVQIVDWRESQASYQQPQPVGNQLQLVLAVNLRKQGTEFLAAHARAEGTAVQRLQDVLGNLHQHPIAYRVPVRIVDSLEMIEVQHEHAGRKRPRIEPLLECPAVGQA